MFYLITELWTWAVLVFLFFPCQREEEEVHYYFFCLMHVGSGGGGLYYFFSFSLSAHLLYLVGKKWKRRRSEEERKISPILFLHVHVTPNKHTQKNYFYMGKQLRFTFNDSWGEKKHLLLQQGEKEIQEKKWERGRLLENGITWLPTKGGGRDGGGGGIRKSGNGRLSWVTL